MHHSIEGAEGMVVKVNGSMLKRVARGIFCGINNMQIIEYNLDG